MGGWLAPPPRARVALLLPRLRTRARTGTPHTRAHTRAHTAADNAAAAARSRHAPRGELAERRRRMRPLVRGSPQSLRTRCAAARARTARTEMAFRRSHRRPPLPRAGTRTRGLETLHAPRDSNTPNASLKNTVPKCSLCDSGTCHARDEMRLAPNYTAVIQCGKSGGKCNASIVFFWNELGLELHSVARSPARASARRRAAGRPPQGGRVAGRPFRSGGRARDARGGTAKTAAEAAFRRRPSASSAGACARRARVPPGRPARACLRAAHMPARSILSVLTILGRRAGGEGGGVGCDERGALCAAGCPRRGEAPGAGDPAWLAHACSRARCELILPWKAPVGECDVY